MTTPAAPVVTVTTDKQSYNVGDPIQVTVEYTDPAAAGKTLTISGVVTLPDGTTATGTASVTVGATAPAALPVTVTDSFGGTYTQASNVPGTAVFTGVVAAIPAGA